MPVRLWRTAEAKSKILIRRRKVDLPRIACNSGQRRMRSCRQDCNRLPLEICINHLISSRIRPSAVRVLTSGPHLTSLRCHVKIFDFAMAVPAKPEPASLKACRLARPPSPKGKATGVPTTRDLLKRDVAQTGPCFPTCVGGSTLRHPVGGG